VNYLARLGDPEAENRIEPLEKLAARFDPARLSTARPRFDPAVLEHWQRLALAALPVAELADWAGETLNGVPEAARNAFLDTVRPNIGRPADVAAWAAIVFGDAELPGGIETDAESAVVAAALAAYEAHGPDVKAMAAEARARTGARGAGFYHPLRVALTGRHDGPGLAELLAIMPADTIRARLAHHAGGRKEPSCSSSTTR
jgi:glutamyl-tRNA synthetase